MRRGDGRALTAAASALWALAAAQKDGISSSSLPEPPKALHILPSRRVSLQGGFSGAHSPATGSLGP